MLCCPRSKGEPLQEEDNSIIPSISKAPSAKPCHSLAKLSSRTTRYYIYFPLPGSYDNEGIAIFALMFTYYLWIKAVKTGSVYWAVWTALSYFYMVRKLSKPTI